MVKPNNYTHCPYVLIGLTGLPVTWVVGLGGGFGVDPPISLAIYPIAPAAAMHAKYSAGAPRAERPNEKIARITLAAAMRPAHAGTPIAAP